MEALIVGNGPPPSDRLLQELMAGNPLLLCADGGADTVMARGWLPDYVVGDMDSVACRNAAAMPPERFVRVDDDDTGTDLQKVIRQAVSLGVRAATLTGVTGGRSDHTLWNLSMLRLYRDSLRLRVVDDFCEIRLVNGEIRFRAEPGQKLSLTPLSGPAVGVRTTGLRFALHGEILAPAIRDGISNEVVDGPVTVSVAAGDLLLVIHRDTAPARIIWDNV